MVKRAKTPEADEHSKFFAVKDPYPPHAYMELEAHRKQFAFWIASIVGKDALIAFYHKPRSEGMVILEISKRFAVDRQLLGEHKWSKILRSPDEDIKHMSSRIYYCVHNTQRMVQKNGWKEVIVEEHWFKGWVPNNKIIVHPYPETDYCDLPHEDMTNRGLCRPLPVAEFPRPDTPPRIVPGSRAWLEERKEAPAEPITRDEQGQWTRNGSKPNANGPPSATRSESIPSGLKPQATKGRNKGAPSVQNGVEKASEPHDSWTNGKSTAWDADFSSNASADSPSTSPDFPVGNLTLSNAPRVPPGLGMPEEQWPEADDDEIAMLEANMVGASVSDREDEDDRPVVSPEENLWKGHDEPRPMPLLKSQYDCPVHGRTCAKGICEDYAKLKREKAKAERQKEREAQQGKGRGKGRKDRSNSKSGDSSALATSNGAGNNAPSPVTVSAHSGTTAVGTVASGGPRPQGAWGSPVPSPALKTPTANAWSSALSSAGRSAVSSASNGPAGWSSASSNTGSSSSGPSGWGTVTGSSTRGSGRGSAPSNTGSSSSGPSGWGTVTSSGTRGSGRGSAHSVVSSRGGGAPSVVGARGGKSARGRGRGSNGGGAKSVVNRARIDDQWETQSAATEVQSVADSEGPAGW